MTTVHTLTASDGTRLALHALGPEDGARVLMVPGVFTSHTFWLGTRGVGMARHLADAGFRCLVLDPRGHGSSDPFRPGWRYADWVLRDLPAALEAASDGGRPVVALGHSAGGAGLLAALAGQPALRPRVAGLVLMASPHPGFLGLRLFFAALAIAASRILGRFPARALGMGPDDETGGVMAEWLGWNVRGRWSSPSGEDWLPRAREVTVPVLAVAGDDDRLWAPPWSCRKLLEATGATDRTFHAFGRSSGLPVDLGHSGLVVSREAREHVWPLVAEWIRERVGSGPSGLPGDGLPRPGTR